MELFFLYFTIFLYFKESPTRLPSGGNRKGTSVSSSCMPFFIFPRGTAGPYHSEVGIRFETISSQLLYSYNTIWRKHFDVTGMDVLYHWPLWIISLVTVTSVSDLLLFFWQNAGSSQTNSSTGWVNFSAMNWSIWFTSTTNFWKYEIWRLTFLLSSLS